MKIETVKEIVEYAKYQHIFPQHKSDEVYDYSFRFSPNELDRLLKQHAKEQKEICALECIKGMASKVGMWYLHCIEQFCKNSKEPEYDNRRSK